MTFKFKHVQYTEAELTDNIVAWYHSAQQNLTGREFQEAKEWYTDAHNFALGLAAAVEDKFTLSQVVAVIAALSPANGWDQNKLDAVRLIDAAYYGADCPLTCTYPAQTEKAWAILTEGVNPREHLGASAPKTKAFYDCILSPNDTESVCVDRHAINVGRNVVSAEQNLSCSLKVYTHFSNAYKKAGQLLGVPASQVQSVTWVHYKNVVGR